MKNISDSLDEVLSLIRQLDAKLDQVIKRKETDYKLLKEWKNKKFNT